jgi:RNA polymerase sigma-70 factor (ECF subfamily)
VTKSHRLHLSDGDPDGRGAEFAALVRKAARGDHAAMEDLLVRAQETAFRFSFLVCGHAEDAEDVMQDALLKTYEHVARIREPEAFRTWLYSTIRNACLMKRRRRVDEPTHHEPIEHDGNGETGGAHEVADRRMLPDEAAINAWLGRRLRAALNTLHPGYRVIVFLREMEGLSTREVARIAGISEANVKARLHRARVMLREQLGDV